MPSDFHLCIFVGSTIQFITANKPNEKNTTTYFQTIKVITAHKKS